MRTPIAVALVILIGLGAAATLSRSRDAPVWLVADHRLTVNTPAGTGELALYVSRDWDQPQPAIVRAIVTIHGLNRAADLSRTIAEVGRASSGLDPDSVLLIEPQFLNETDVAAYRLPARTLYWRGARWEAAEDAHGPARISSFAALDAILAKLADHAVFPALKTVVVAGHSGGGQFVQRYAVAGRGEGALIQAGIHVRYVVANPSSYLYFTPERPAGDEFPPFDGAACPTFDNWKYGVRGWPQYLAGDDPSKLEADYAARDVVYLLGTADDDPNNPTLDKTCMAEAEGSTRYERGVAYFHYLEARHRTGLAHRLLLVPGVGHNEDGVFNSSCGLAALYDLPGCNGG
jgi:pimeloyl-ACP methyl ester carboxylesterase